MQSGAENQSYFRMKSTSGFQGPLEGAGWVYNK